jgi:hypothetical protein
MSRVTGTITDRARHLWRTWGTRRSAPFLGALPVVLRLLLGAALVGLAAAGGATLQATWAALPPIDPAGFVTGALMLAALWVGTVLLVRSPPSVR